MIAWLVNCVAKVLIVGVENLINVAVVLMQLLPALPVLPVAWSRLDG